MMVQYLRRRSSWLSLEFYLATAGRTPKWYKRKKDHGKVAGCRIIPLSLLLGYVTFCHMKKPQSLARSRPSLRSIADACGISYQTVSRIINGKTDRHTPKTVALVEGTAAKMGYRKNLLARGMLTGKSMTVGVMLPYYINRGFNTGILQGIQGELARHDYAALIISVAGTKEDITHSHQLIERRVDGVVFRPHPMGESDAYLHELMRHHIPMVSVVDIEQSLNIPLDFVGVDEETLGRTAAEYLLSLGHRRLGFTRIGDARFDLPLNERYAAFVTAVESAGGKVVSTPRSQSADFDAAAVEGMLSKRNRPTAVFCSVDDIAFQTIEVAKKLGRSVPGDLSVIGSANYEASRFTSPTLTTFDLQTEETPTAADQQRQCPTLDLANPRRPGTDRPEFCIPHRRSQRLLVSQPIFSLDVLELLLPHGDDGAIGFEEKPGAVVGKIHILKGGSRGRVHVGFQIDIPINRPRGAPPVLAWSLLALK